MAFKLEKENRGSGVHCAYRRIREKSRWASACGKYLSFIGHDYKYCPFCGKEIRKAI